MRTPGGVRRYRVFLMHRVELKVGGGGTDDGKLPFVPNAPCGVESLLFSSL